MYLKILHPLIKIVLAPPESLKLGDDLIPFSLCLPQAIDYPNNIVPLPPLRGRGYIDGVPLIGLIPFGPFPYPINL